MYGVAFGILSKYFKKAIRSLSAIDDLCVWSHEG